MRYYPSPEGRRLQFGDTDTLLPYETLVPPLEDVECNIHNQLYKVPDELRQLRQRIKGVLEESFHARGVVYFPHILTRLSSMKSLGTTEQAVATLQPVPYTEVVATNLIADLPLADFSFFAMEAIGQRSNARTLREYDLARSGAEGTLPPLHRTLFANPLGVAGIAITRDHKVLIMHRSEFLSTYADVLGPTSSGYVEWDDVSGVSQCSLNDVLTRALIREIEEELCVEAPEIGQFIPLGVYREFYRAGFPQAFYSFYVHITAEEVASRIMDSDRPSEFQAMLAFRVNSPSDFRAKVKTLILTEKVSSWTVGMELKGILTAATLSQLPQVLTD